MPHAPDQLLCLEFLTAVDLDAPSFVSLAAQHGFRRISLLVNPMSPPYQDFDLLGNSATRQETRRRCEDLGIAVDMIEAFNIQADTNPLSFVPALESGAVLGRPVVNLLPRDDDEARIADGFAGACALADRYGFPVMTEISRRATLKTLPQAVSFFKRIGRPDLRVVLDTLHFFRFGGTLDQVREYRDWIGRIQISDGPAEMPLADQLTEARQRRLIPGDGALPLRELLAALNPGLTIGIEVPNPDFTTDERVRRSREATLALMTTVKHA
jgi:sugar phosphate isomerase/epimerase